MENKIIDIIQNLTGYNNLNKNKNIDLLENDILDSLAFIELISTLEEEFDIEIQPTEVSPDSWRTVDNICKLIENLK